MPNSSQLSAFSSQLSAISKKRWQRLPELKADGFSPL